MARRYERVSSVSLNSRLESNREERRKGRVSELASVPRLSNAWPRKQVSHFSCSLPAPGPGHAQVRMVRKHKRVSKKHICVSRKHTGVSRKHECVSKKHEHVSKKQVSVSRKSHVCPEAV